MQKSKERSAGSKMSEFIGNNLGSIQQKNSFIIDFIGLRLPQCWVLSYEKATPHIRLPKRFNLSLPGWYALHRGEI